MNKYSFFRFLPDKYYLKLRYYICFHKKLNLKNPKTFNEKLNWLKLYDRNDLYTKMVDKYEVKDYVKNIIGEEYIIKTLGVYDKFDDIDFDKLPNQFVIKCTHDSGGLVICKDKNELDIEKSKNKIEKSLKSKYFYHSREWPYKNVKPRIIIEEYMGDNLNDYKIFCFNDEPKYILVCSNRNGKFKNTDFFDFEWQLQPFNRTNHSNNANGIPKPKNLNDMYKISKELCKNLKFIRVDLYEIDGKLYFGELTFYPSSGFEGFSPAGWDEIIGNLLKIK